MLPVLTGFFKLICPKFDYDAVTTIVKNERVQMNLKQKLALLNVILVSLLMMAPSFLPKGTALYAFIGNFGVIGGMCAASVLMMVIVIGGETLGDIVEGMRKSIPWDMYFLLAAALSLSTAITAEGTGVGPFLKIVCAPLLADKNAFIFLAILVLIGAVVTNCLNNIVTLTLLIPTSLAFAAAYGVSGQFLVAVFAIILYQGVVLPSGSVMGAMLHGNKDWADTRSDLQICQLRRTDLSFVHDHRWAADWTILAVLKYDSKAVCHFLGQAAFLCPLRGTFFTE